MRGDHASFTPLSAGESRYVQTRPSVQTRHARPRPEAYDAVLLRIILQLKQIAVKESQSNLGHTFLKNVQNWDWKTIT